MPTDTPAAPATPAPTETTPAPPATPAPTEPSPESLLPNGEVDRAAVVAKLRAHRLAAEKAEEASKPPPAEVPAEPPATEAPKEEAPKESASERFALLAREQKRLRQEREVFKREAAELESWKKTKAEASRNPNAALKELGLSYEQLTEQILSSGKVDPVATVQEQMRALKAELDSERAARAQANEAAALNDFRQSISKAAAAGGEKYELVQARKAEDIALQVIQQHFRETGEMLGGTPDAAIGIALEHVEALLEKDADSWLSAKKVQRKLRPAGNELASPTGPRAGRVPTVEKPRTLTNSQASAVPTPAEEPESTDPKVLRERLQRTWRSIHRTD